MKYCGKSGNSQFHRRIVENPLEEYKSAHESLAECYDAYLTFTGLAVYPTDSLNTFSEDFDNTKTVSCDGILYAGLVSKFCGLLVHYEENIYNVNKYKNSV